MNFQGTASEFCSLWVVITKNDIFTDFFRVAWSIFFWFEGVGRGHRISLLLWFLHLTQHNKTTLAISFHIYHNFVSQHRKSILLPVLGFFTARRITIQSTGHRWLQGQANPESQPQATTIHRTSTQKKVGQHNVTERNWLCVCVVGTYSCNLWHHTRGRCKSKTDCWLVLPVQNYLTKLHMWIACK